MRKVIFGGANSLDNFFARKDDSVDWLIWSKDVTRLMTEFWKNIDTMLMGRRTYEVSLGMGGGGEHPGVKTYVFSRTLEAVKGKNTELVSEDAAEFLRQLKKQPGKDILVMGGGLLAKSFFEADLIDEIGFNIHPVLLGSGVPLFHEMKTQIDLDLVSCEQISKGCVVLTYRVKHKNSPRGGKIRRL